MSYHRIETDALKPTDRVTVFHGRDAYKVNPDRAIESFNGRVINYAEVTRYASIIRLATPEDEAYSAAQAAEKQARLNAESQRRDRILQALSGTTELAYFENDSESSVTVCLPINLSDLESLCDHLRQWKP